MASPALQDKIKAEHTGAAKTRRTTVAHDAAQFQAPAERLIQALQFSTAPTAKSAPSDKVKVRQFQRAYAAIIRTVPADLRQQLRRQMIEGLENVSPAELSADEIPASVAVTSTRVTTGNFMGDMEQQEKRQRAQDVSAGALVSATEMAQRLPMTKQGLSHALKARRLFTLIDDIGQNVYPAFFSDRSLDRKQLEKVSKALGDLPGAAKWDFFTSPRVSLGKRTPLQALAKGKFEAVMAAANAFADE